MLLLHQAWRTHRDGCDDGRGKVQKHSFHFFPDCSTKYFSKDSSLRFRMALQCRTMSFVMHSVSLPEVTSTEYKNVASLGTATYVWGFWVSPESTQPSLLHAGIASKYGSSRITCLLRWSDSCLTWQRSLILIMSLSPTNGLPGFINRSASSSLDVNTTKLCTVICLLRKWNIKWLLLRVLMPQISYICTQIFTVFLLKPKSLTPLYIMLPISHIKKVYGL